MDSNPESTRNEPRGGLATPSPQSLRTSTSSTNLLSNYSNRNPDSNSDSPSMRKSASHSNLSRSASPSSALDSSQSSSTSNHQNSPSTPNHAANYATYQSSRSVRNLNQSQDSNSLSPFSSSSPTMMRSNANGNLRAFDRGRQSVTPEREELRQQLKASLEGIHRSEPSDLLGKLHLGAQVHRLLVESSVEEPVKDDFKDAGGFLAVIQMLSALESTLHLTESSNSSKGKSKDERDEIEGEELQRTPKASQMSLSDPSSEMTPTEKEMEDPALIERHRCEVFKMALCILNEAISHHTVNLQVLESLGWESLTASLRLSTIAKTSPHLFFSSLLGFALGDVSTFSGRLMSLKTELEDADAPSSSSPSTSTKATSASGSPESPTTPLSASTEARFSKAEKRIQDQWSGNVAFGKVVVIVLQLQRELKEQERELRLTIATILHHMASTRRNQVSLSSAGVGSELLKCLEIKDPEIKSTFLSCTSRILSLGIPTQDAKKLLQDLANDDKSNSISSKEGQSTMDLLLGISQPSRDPNSVQFEMATHGHSSLALSNLRRPFPPPPSCKGWTFSAHIMIDRIEPSLPLDLVHFFDAQHTCSVKLTIEPGTGQLNYSTSVEDQRTRFKNFQFVSSNPYHIVLMHPRPKPGSKTSVVELYVDGILVDHQSAAWPTSPPSLGSPVRAVFGTPPSTSTVQARQVGESAEHQKRRTNRLIWSLGPTFALDTLLPPDLPLVLYELTARYSGNLQDSLGRFLTYRASSNINLRLDAVAREAPKGGANSEKDLAKHPLVTAIAGRSSALFPEERFYFILNSANTTPAVRLSRRVASDSHSSSSVSTDASHRPGPIFILNQALPLTRDAIAASYGYAKLHGDPVISTPKGLDETIWKLGGCSILLRLIEKSMSTEALSKSLKLFFELVEHSWRLSEDVERVRGYEILALLLRQKIRYISPQILNAFLSAVGIDMNSPDSAALVNPFLYRIVLLDLEIWSRTTTDLQKIHLEHFSVLLRISKNRRFNVKRVARMQIVKKLLYGLRSGLYGDEMIPHVVAAVRACSLSSFSEATIRVISSYLAASLCQGPEVKNLSEMKPRRLNTIDAGLDVITQANPPSSPTKQENQSSAPLQLFEVLSDLILNRPVYLSKFGSCVNIKWTLIFFHPRAEPTAVGLSLEILSKLLLQDDGQYSQKLSAAGGFKVLERLLPRFWSLPSVLPTCWSILLARERLVNKTLFDSFSPSVGSSTSGVNKVTCIACPHIMRAIVACFKSGVKALASRDADSGRSRRAAQPRPSDLLIPGNTGKGKHARKRSQSMNVDTKSLSNLFQATSEQSRLTDTVKLIEAHCNASNEFRDLLFSPIILRGIVDAVLPSIEAESSRPANTEPGAAETLCSSIVALLAKLSFESMISSGSIAAITALLNAVPPTDLSLVSLFRTAFYSRLVSLVQATVDSSPSTLEAPNVAQAFAAFIEQASDEILSGSPLENDLFNLITSILPVLASSSFFGPDSPPNRSVLISLNRILLYRLTLPNDIRKTFEQVLENQASIFSPENSDSAFLHALLNRVGFYLTEGDEETRLSSFNILKLMTLSRPAIVEPVLIEGTTAPDLLGCELEKAPGLLVGQDQEPKQLPHSQAWLAFLKSLETLKGAAHLERVAHVKELLDRVDLREGAVVSTEKRMISWHSSLCASEDLRFSKFSQDGRELTVFAAVEWKKLRDGLERERSIFGPDIDPERHLRFKHDPTEGPRRMRNKLTELPKRDGDDQDDVPYQEETEMSSTLPGSPVAELEDGEAWDNNDAVLVGGGHTISGSEEQELGNVNSNPSHLDEPEAADSGNDDKFRRVLRSLERGDIIEDVFNTSRAVGIESRGSLLIIGKKCLYLVDDVLQRRNGELVNSWEAPAEERDALVMATLTPSNGTDNVSGPTGLVSQLEGDAQTRKWPWADVQQAHKRSWLHRRTAVEIFFSDGQSFLLVLAKAATAAQVYKELKLRAPAAVSASESLRDGIKESSSAATGTSGNSLSSRLAGVLGRNQAPGALTQAWVQRKISSFDYLMALNTIAGRSFNDITQYPVFPWLIADWESQELDLNDPQTFRKLELPMGAQTPARRREFEERYRQLQEVDMDDSGKPFHYGTHYSTAATVCGYLIRMRPYERILMTLQGGTFDLPDRIFNSLSRAWKSASELSRGDVREMIPEAFILPEFLSNRNRFHFGTTQSGEEVDQVDLPPWAHDDPMLFIMKHREALESDFVSSRLHHWIDLIFGCRSRGDAAVESTNVFHPLSYDDGVDLDAIESPLERQAAASAIHSFGQTPLRLFSNPHPQRSPAPSRDLASISSPDQLDFVDHIFLLIEGIAPIRTLKASAHFIYATHPERAFASPKDYLIIPKLGLSLSREHLDGSVRIFSSKDSARPVGVSEQLTAEPITCFAQGGPGTIVTGSEDGLVTMWKIDLVKKELSFLDVYRGHSASVLCIAASNAWSIAVSGSQDSTAIIWDTNRGLYVHSLRDHEGPVHLVSIDEQNGYIATCSLSTVYLWTINGELLASVSTSSSLSDPVASLAFYERDVHVGRLALLLTGHRGKVIAWSCVGTHVEEPQKSHKRSRSRSETGGRASMSKKAWKLEPYHVFEHHDRIGPDTTPLITSIKTTSHKLFTGDSHGRLFVWSLPGSAVALPDSYSAVCMNTDSCGKKFGVLEAKRTCSGCGGLFCLSCVANFWGGRYCSSCRVILPSPP